MILINKSLGQTPLEALKEFRNQNPNYKDIKLAYAGRLDPMATGLLIVLVGDECKRRDEFQALEKEYIFEVLMGVQTDTLDTLGLLQKTDTRQFTRAKTKKSLESLVGKFNQEFPAYSSKVVNKRPMYYWARENKLNEIKVPTKEVEVIEIKYLNEYKLSSEEIYQEVARRVSLVSGDFRQEEILKSWKGIVNLKDEMQIVKLQAVVSSGTYIRSLSQTLGKKLGTSAIAWSIHRSRVGKYEL